MTVAGPDTKPGATVAPLNRRRRGPLRASIAKNPWLYAMLMFGLIHMAFFYYGPMFGLVAAFQDFNPFQGFIGSPWVGLKHFRTFFASSVSGRIVVNTFALAGINLLLYFPVPIAIALMINEIQSRRVRRWAQTIMYLPHFVSWPVVASITFALLSNEFGLVNSLLENMGRQAVPFLVSEVWFRPVYYLQLIWKEAGYGTIIYLAAIAGVDPALYESATIDGAGRLQLIWYITLASIRPTIVILFLLRIGHFLDTGFEQVYLLRNALNSRVSEVIDTYTYIFGIQGGQLSYTAAIGLLKSIFGFLLVLLADWSAKRLGEEGIL